MVSTQCVTVYMQGQPCWWGICLACSYNPLLSKHICLAHSYNPLFVGQNIVSRMTPKHIFWKVSLSVYYDCYPTIPSFTVNCWNSHHVTATITATATVTTSWLSTIRILRRNWTFGSQISCLAMWANKQSKNKEIATTLLPTGLYQCAVRSRMTSSEVSTRYRIPLHEKTRILHKQSQRCWELPNCPKLRIPCIRVCSTNCTQMFSYLSDASKTQ